MPPLELTLSKKFKAKQVGAKIKEAAADDKARHRYGTMRIEVLSDLKKDFCQLSHCQYIFKKTSCFQLTISLLRSVRKSDELFVAPPMAEHGRPPGQRQPKETSQEDADQRHDF